MKKAATRLFSPFVGRFIRRVAVQSAKVAGLRLGVLGLFAIYDLRNAVIRELEVGKCQWHPVIILL